MRILLDTNALSWWLLDEGPLSEIARREIANPQNEILVSAVSAFEMATKHQIGKWPEVAGLLEKFEVIIERESFIHLPVTFLHSLASGRLPAVHRDPFDRLLAAQAIVEDVSILTNDVRLKELGARVMW